MGDVVAVFMRWLHLSSVAVLVGGLLYGWMALQAASGAVAPEAVLKISDSVARRFRPVALFCVLILILSGVYNVLTTPGHSTRYHIVLGVKLLLVLHIFASAILAMRPGNAKRGRMMASAGFSGLAVILISAYLRRIF